MFIEPFDFFVRKNFFKILIYVHKFCATISSLQWRLKESVIYELEELVESALIHSYTLRTHLFSNSLCVVGPMRRLHTQIFYMHVEFENQPFKWNGTFHIAQLHYTIYNHYLQSSFFNSFSDMHLFFEETKSKICFGNYFIVY